MIIIITQMRLLIFRRRDFYVFLRIYVHHQGYSLYKVHESLEIDLSVHTWDISASLEDSLQPKLGFLLRIELLQEVDYSHRVQSFCDWLESIDVSEVSDFLNIHVTTLIELTFFAFILWFANCKKEGIVHDIELLEHF